MWEGGIGISEINFALYFTKMSFDHEVACMRTLRAPQADKRARFGLVCAFFGHGYEVNEAVYLISRFQAWENFNCSESEKHIRKIYQQLERTKYRTAKDFSIPCCPFPTKKAISYKDVFYKFFSVCKPVLDIRPPAEIWDAVRYYYDLGFHPWSMSEDKRPQRGRRWKKYQDEQPSMKVLESLDWKNGILLLGTMKNSFLDIDIRSEKHPDGVEGFDERILDGWYFERTKNGGYHVFGAGGWPKGTSGLKCAEVEIKHTGGYIVAYPTPGYQMMQSTMYASRA